MDPVFYVISLAEPPRDPLVPGTPSKIVEFDGSLFVAARSRLFAAPVAGGEWKASPTAPSGGGFDVAATVGFLYALSGNGTENRLFRIGAAALGSGGGWDEVAVSAGADAIFAIGNRLFVSVPAEGGGYSIFSVADDESSSSLILSGASMLTGSAGSFLSAIGGVYRWDGSALSPVGTGIFMGIIELPSGDVVAAHHDGRLFSVSSGGIDAMTTTGGASLRIGSRATGALAVANVADTDSSDRVLVAGRQSPAGQSAFGYVEFALTASGAIDPSLNAQSGAGLRSILHPDRFSTSLGRHSVNRLFFKEGAGFFASTAATGLWLYEENRWRVVE